MQGSFGWERRVLAKYLEGGSERMRHRALTEQQKTQMDGSATPR